MSDKKTKTSGHAEEPQAEEILDNVGEAASETENMTDQDIENAEMSEIDRLAKELADEKLKVEKEKKEYLFLLRPPQVWTTLRPYVKAWRSSTTSL